MIDVRGSYSITQKSYLRDLTWNTAKTIGNTPSIHRYFSDWGAARRSQYGEMMLKRLFLFILLLSSSFVYAKTVTSVAVTPHGAVIVVGTSLQYSAICTYSDGTTDNCAAAGGVTWSTPTVAMSVTSSGLATWSSQYDPHNSSIFTSGAPFALGLVYATVGSLSDYGQVMAQSPSDVFYTYTTPDPSFYQDIQTNAQLPINVVVGSTVTMGIGFQIGGTGDANPFQMTCNWSSSDPAVATISRYGLATAVSPGSVTMTCGQAGNGVYATGSGFQNTFSFNVVAPTPTNQTWYVRPKGGTPYVSATQTPAGQCDGKHDADYPGSGVNQPCAMGNLSYLWLDQVSHNHEQWMIGPGDTVIVRQKTGGYNIGLNQLFSGFGGTTLDPTNCGNPDCYMPTIPSGTASNHTKILGENYASCHADSAKTTLNVSWASKFGINVRDSQYVDVACFEVTDQAQCGGGGAYSNVCNQSSNAGVDGLLESALSANDTYTDLFIHGLAWDGIFGATGANVVANYVHIQAMPDSGVNMDDGPHGGMSNISVAGGFTMNNSITEFTGCVEEYPVVHNYPYIECRDQNAGGYGDGFGTASTTGNWSFDHDIWRYNFQDGLDLLHSGMQSVIVTNSQSYGNDGQAYKMGPADTVIFQNNLALENCNRIGSTIGDEPSSAIVSGVALCRADGGWISMQFTPSGTYKLQNNTLIGYGDVALGYSCSAGGDNCSSANTTLQNNVFLGYSDNGYNGDEPSAMFCAVVGSNCNQNLPNFPANQGWATRSNNVYFGTRTCPVSLTANESCNTSNPLFTVEPASPITVESVFDPLTTNSTYTGTSTGYTLTSASPLIGAGVSISGLLSDLLGALRPTPPSIGALEYSSATAVASSQVSLTATPTSATAGQAVTLSASIATTSGSTVPTGTVTFFSNGTALSSTSVNSSGVATLSTSSLPTGSDSLTATYSGDSTYAAGASNTLSLTVSPAPAVNTTTSLQISPSPATAGHAVTMTATVTAASGTGKPTGTVSFLNGGGTSLGTATLNSSGVATFTTSSLTQGSYQITAQYAANSSFNASASSAVSETINAAPATTTTTSLQASANPITAGQPLSLTATVTATSGTATGTVSFLSSGVLLGTATLNSSGVATWPISSMSTGSYSITAQYAGNSSFSASASSVVTEIVNATPATKTTTALQVSPNPATAGQSVSMTATVTAASGTATGTVSFMNGGTSLGTATISSGVATLTTSSLAQGNYQITAQYAGNSSFNASASSAVSETVNAAPAAKTTTALQASPTTIIVGQIVTLTATVATASGTPTGTVSFMNGGTSLGTATITSGVAALTTSSLTQGTYQITAQYVGNSSFSASASSTVTETVNAAPAAATTTSLQASPTTITAGQIVTLTAAVATASGTPTGTITFLNNGTPIGTAAISSGLAALTTSSLPQGTYQITAQYAGNSSFSASASPTITETVNAAPATAVATRTALQASPTTITAGQAVTLTATVATASGTPTGTVSFLNGGTLLGTAPISSGVATLPISSLAEGTYQITAQYAGTSNFNPSASSAVTETVNAPPPGATTTTLQGPSGPVDEGQPVTLTATVTSASGTPTGTVSFLNGTTLLGSSPLNSAGQATYSASSSTAGTFQLTAQYGGNNTFNPSVSSNVPWIVSAPGITVTSSSPTVTLARGTASSTVTLTLTPVNGYSGTLQMTCPNPPTGTSCSFQTPSVTVNSSTGPVNVVMTVQNTLTTVSASVHDQQPITPGKSLIFSASILWIPGILAAALVGKKRKLLGRAGTLLLLLLLAGGFGTLTGCGVGATYRTISNTLNVMVTGTGNVAQSISLNVISQQ